MKLGYSLAVIACLAAGGVGLPAEGVSDAQSAKKTPSPFETAPRIRGFSVTLVLGEMQGAATPDNLPAGAKKALDDMRGFLPYKSFRLLDTQWILCCATGGFADVFPPTLLGRLRGDEEQEYQFGITILDASGPQLSVRYVMNHAGPSATKKLSNAELEARMHLAEALRQLAEAQNSGKPTAPLQARVEEIQRDMGGLIPVNVGAKGAVIDSTFSMDVGETVVIGTSSLKGDKALIALLTAAPRSGGASVK